MISLSLSTFGIDLKYGIHAISLAVTSSSSLGTPSPCQCGRHLWMVPIVFLVDFLAQKSEQRAARLSSESRNPNYGRKQRSGVNTQFVKTRRPKRMNAHPSFYLRSKAVLSVWFLKTMANQRERWMSLSDP